MPARILKPATEKTIVDLRKRAFMKKFGQYALTGAGMATLMTPTHSSAHHYTPYPQQPTPNTPD